MNQEESEHNEVDGMKKGVDSKGEVMRLKIVETVFTDKRRKRSFQLPSTVYQELSGP